MTTDWYEPHQKPVRVGLYEISFFDSGWSYEWWALWDGRHWRDHSGCTLIDQNITWRGLTTEQTKC